MEGGETRSQLNGQWKVPLFGALGRFHYLMANGTKRETFFHLFPLSSRQILLKPSIFSFDFKILLYHGLPLVTYAFPSFSFTYKLCPHILIKQIFHHSLPI
jgi:hypothetical protein